MCLVPYEQLRESEKECNRRAAMDSVRTIVEPIEKGVRDV